jgi:hypothetical protein
MEFTIVLQIMTKLQFTVSSSGLPLSALGGLKEGVERHSAPRRVATLMFCTHSSRGRVTIHTAGESPKGVIIRFTWVFVLLIEMTKEKLVV